MFDSGNTGFMLLATCLVVLMTPAFALFYGGLAGRKNVLAAMLRAFVSMSIAAILWVACGYSLSFSGGVGGVIGNLDHAFLRGISPQAVFAGSSGIPLLVFILYQMMFAIVAPALVTGAVANRMRFGAYLIFLVLWQFLVYFPIVHMVWGGGLLQQWGVRDFAGGIVVHAIAGMAALASVLFARKRGIQERGLPIIQLVGLGTALLWFGWYGFLAGSQLPMNQQTALAFLNTNVAASFAVVTWIVTSWAIEKKPNLLGLLIGAVAGLVTITPCAGYVTTTSAALIGIIAGFVCYHVITLKNKRGWDDALNIWALHGIGGVLGTILLGVFGTVAVSTSAANGLLYGGAQFLLKQTIAVLMASAWAFLITYGSFHFVNLLTRAMVTQGERATALDDDIRGEQAFG